MLCYGLLFCIFIALSQALICDTSCSACVSSLPSGCTSCAPFYYFQPSGTLAATGHCIFANSTQPEKGCAKCGVTDITTGNVTENAATTKADGFCYKIISPALVEEYYCVCPTGYDMATTRSVKITTTDTSEVCVAPAAASAQATCGLVYSKIDDQYALSIARVTVNASATSGANGNNVYIKVNVPHAHSIGTLHSRHVVIGFAATINSLTEQPFCLFPGPAWKQEEFDATNCSSVYSYNASINELSLCEFTSSITNGGSRITYSGNLAIYIYDNFPSINGNTDYNLNTELLTEVFYPLTVTYQTLTRQLTFALGVPLNVQAPLQLTGHVVTQAYPASSKIVLVVQTSIQSLQGYWSVDKLSLASQQAYPSILSLESTSPAIASCLANQPCLQTYTLTLTIDPRQINTATCIVSGALVLNVRIGCNPAITSASNCLLTSPTTGQVQITYSTLALATDCRLSTIPVVDNTPNAFDLQFSSVSAYTDAGFTSPAVEFTSAAAPGPYPLIYFGGFLTSRQHNISSVTVTRILYSAPNSDSTATAMDSDPSWGFGNDVRTPPFFGAHVLLRGDRLGNSATGGPFTGQTGNVYFTIEVQAVISSKKRAIGTVRTTSPILVSVRAPANSPTTLGGPSPGTNPPTSGTSQVSFSIFTAFLPFTLLPWLFA